MKFSLNSRYSLSHWLNFFPNWHRYAFEIIPKFLCIGDLDPIIKDKVLYKGYPLNRYMKFLKNDILQRQA